MTAALARLQFRLQLRNVTELDIAKISAFLRVGHDRFVGDWTVVAGGACHVIVLGGQQPTRASENGAVALSRVHDAGASHNPGTLVRPLQYDAFIDALSATERTLGNKGPASVLADARASAPAPKVRERASLRTALSVPSGAGFRLRRWPPATILRAHRYNVRLASFMSGRHVCLDELIRLSNVEKSQCERFLVDLRDAEILDVRSPDTGLPRTTTSTSPAPATASHFRTQGGLFDQIRSRLRLGRAE